MMHPYRCAICGETSLMSGAPERCPFCGSDKKHLLPAAEWIDYGKVDMSEQSYKDCLRALELELNNYAYYKCSVDKAENQVTEAIFKRLMKQEYEHAEIFSDALGIPIPEERIRNCCNSDFKNMKNSNEHETKAITFYTEAANRAPEPRMRQIFRAIAEVENEHLIITNMYLFRDGDSCIKIDTCQDKCLKEIEDIKEEIEEIEEIKEIKDIKEEIIEEIEDIKED